MECITPAFKNDSTRFNGTSVLTDLKKASIKRQVSQVQKRVVRAAEKSDRPADDVILIAISKTHSVEMIKEVVGAGITHIGENRIQEAEPKISKLADLPITWHMVGHLQRNKAQAAIEKFERLHSLDSKRLARRLQKMLKKTDISSYPTYVQVNVSGEESKYGIEPDDLEPLLDMVAEECPRLQVQGLMTIAPYVDDETILREAFSELRELRESIPADRYPNVDLWDLSMGMTNDYEIAVEEGATHLRLGRAIFGEREYS